MLKCFLIALLPLLITCSVQAQQFNRVKLDSLLHVLPTLKDTARIDCLSEIGVQYIYKADKDSTVYYAERTYQQSKKINYIYGLAEACVLKGAIADNLYNDFTTMERMAREAIKWFGQTFNSKFKVIAYWQLGRALTNESRYEEALVHLKIAYKLAEQSNYEDGMESSLETITDVYRDQGEYVKLLQTQQKLIQMDRRSGDTDAYSGHELWVLGIMDRLLEEYETALGFWRQLHFRHGDHGFGWVFNQMEYAELFTLTHQYDSALYYYNLFDSAKAAAKDIRYFLVSKGEYYLSLKEYKTALPYFLKGREYHLQANDRIQLKRALLDVAKTYASLQNNDSAIYYARMGLAMALQAGAKPNLRDGYEILYLVYDRLHQIDSSFFYYRNYMGVKEAVMNNQTRGKLATFNYKHEVEILNKEKQIQQQQFQQTILQKKLLWVSIAGLLLLDFIIIRTILVKRKNEKQHRERAEHELQIQKLEAARTRAELEMQALRAQMNPHFIFNCLNAINHFIVNNESESAADFLTKFSRLIRSVLNFSQKPEISLQEELDYLNLYIQIEQLRFQKHFQYTIQYADTIDPESIMIPPMLLQPFVENAIWHGLMHKQEVGELSIDITMNENLLCCTITDNGIGRSKASALKSKSAGHNKSMGMQITANRLQLLNEGKHEGFFFNIIDLEDAHGKSVGTKVVIAIPTNVFQNSVSDVIVC